MADWIKRIDWGQDQRVKCCLCGGPVAEEVVSTRPCGDHWQARPYKAGESGKQEPTGVWVWCPKCWEVEQAVTGVHRRQARAERIREWLGRSRQVVGAWFDYVGGRIGFHAGRFLIWIKLHAPTLLFYSLLITCVVVMTAWSYLLLTSSSKSKVQSQANQVTPLLIPPSVTMAVSCLGTYRVTWYASGKNLDGSSFRGLYDTCAARVIATRGEWLLVVRRTPEGHRFSTMVYVNDHMGAVVLHGKAQPPASVKALVQRKAVAALDLSGAAAKRLYMLSAGSYPCEVWELYPDTAEIKGGK